MPSIAGVVIVSWLCTHGGEGFREILLLPASVKAVAGSSSLQPHIDATSLTLLFLYGNIFCYIASYPILVFHVTRTIDFREGKWTARINSDGYMAAILVVIISFVICRLAQAEIRFWLAFALAGLLVCLQFSRLMTAMTRPIRNLPGLSQGTVSEAYAFAYTLAVRRGIYEVETTTPSEGDSEADNAVTDDEDAKTTRRQKAWRQEMIATYRHMREHGNSAFIFLLELGLAGLGYCVITKGGQTATQQLDALAALFALWASPSVFVHLLGQHLERRFSKFDSKLTKLKAQQSAPTPTQIKKG
jgi:hypothetical protein